MTTTNEITNDQFLKHFERFTSVSKQLKEELITRTGLISFKKGDLVHDADKVCTNSYFIINGIIRTYFMKDSKEICEYFSSENEWANSPRSWRTRKPDIYYLDAIEDTTAVCIKANDLLYLFEQFPELDRYGRLSMATLLDRLIDRIASFRFTSAKEKYEHFLKAYPIIHHRIPLGMVATYLGISQETLSRLRSEK